MEERRAKEGKEAEEAGMRGRQEGGVGKEERQWRV